MVCIVLYNEKYGYFESMYNNYIHNTHDSMRQLNTFNIKLFKLEEV